IEISDADGVRVFAVAGAGKAMGFGLVPTQVIILGAVAGVGEATVRDALVGQIPSVMSEGLYAIPALVAAAITISAILTGLYGVAAAIIAATVCWLIRIIGVYFKLNAPQLPGAASIENRSE